MAIDPEQQLYKAMADLTEEVPKLQNEVKSLKRRLTKLSNRIESLELMAFQNQISKLNERIDSINKNLVGTNQIVAISELDALNLHMQDAIRHWSGTGRQKLKEELNIECAKARTKALDSPKPIEVLLDFRKKCMDCSRKYRLGAFTGELDIS